MSTTCGNCDAQWKVGIGERTLVVAASGGFALSLTIVLALIYLGVARLVDLNEKEPLWGIGAGLVSGAIAGAVLPLLVSTTTLELTVWRAAISDELAKLLALVALLALFEGVSRMRGWSEVNGLLDGIVYGAAVGLGFAVGESFYREITAGDILALRDASTWTTLWTTGVQGFSDGIFGAVLGAGFGAAVQARSVLARLVFPVIGLAGAFVLHGLYELLSPLNAEGGSGADVRAWLWLLVPLTFVLLAVALALAQERSAIRTELDGEVGAGLLTLDELRLVENPAARRLDSVARLRARDLDGWVAARRFHNRLVQLALVKRRAKRQTDPHRRAELELEATRLRAAIALARDDVERSISPGPDRQVAMS